MPLKKPKRLTRAQLEQLVAVQAKQLEQIRRRVPNSGLVVGPARPACWSHVPLC